MPIQNKVVFQNKYKLKWHMGFNFSTEMEYK